MLPDSAVGSSLEIAAAFHFVAASSASCRTSEALSGRVGAPQGLLRIISIRRAKDLIFTGHLLGAEGERAAGLVAPAVAPQALVACMAEGNATILKATQAAVAFAKAAWIRGRNATRAAQWPAREAGH